MAKSMRSKWKRKCRAVKRERYAVKELVRLKKTLGVADLAPPAPADPTLPAPASDADAPVIFLDAGQIQSKKKKPQPAAEPESDVEMSSDDERVVVEEDGKKRVFSSKTLKDQNGQYPKWLHKRKIAKMTKTVKKNIKKKKSKKRKH